MCSVKKRKVLFLVMAGLLVIVTTALVPTRTNGRKRVN
jgi:hypothetical protein